MVKMRKVSSGRKRIATVCSCQRPKIIRRTPKRHDAQFFRLELLPVPLQALQGKISKREERQTMALFLMALSSRKTSTLLLVFCLTLTALLFLYFGNTLLLATHQLDFGRLPGDTTHTGSLEFIDQIYVLSLPNRQSRRQDMEKLRHSLGLTWGYVDALPADSPLVERIAEWVTFVRSRYSNGSTTTLKSRGHPLFFTWPEDIDALATSSQELNPWSADLEQSSNSGKSFNLPSQPLTCATEDFKIVPLSAELPEHLFLTHARIACWYSHLSVIQKVANSDKPDTVGAALILEDDVDMEQDIALQLRILWPCLPDGWDIVFLGHCWSDERNGRPLTQDIVNSTFGESLDRHLYASSSPKCTHAYVLSRTGARRLLLHLRYPPFAFSRAIDQALSWLIQSGRLRSYSVVPSLVVQRKIEKSDVMSGVGSKWKDRLTNGIFN
ncbi:hypothetical protein CVT26_015227 [Gymnopilus dilepis]|uniref:Glycosyl transferase family 25 domain-containing protein n=1 Tax=Gymnopilus dilepis TaxID=231916 RepID=A0A409W419_9AGAR|nr:hypothetical protein CVT26_015227 [Gymnopilus dilepis]